MKASILTKITYIILVLATVTITNAQQDPLYSQYMFNPVVLNPAYSGLYDMTSFTVGARQQWSGFSGAPTTFSANAHTTLPVDNMGTGITIIHDKYGANTNTEMNLAFSYNIKTGYYSRIALGLQGGFFSNSFDKTKVTFEEGHEDDPLFNYNKISSPNFGFGILYNTKKIFAGFSVPKLLTVTTTSTVNDTTISIFSPHYYFTGGGIIRLRDDLKLKPSTLVKVIEGAPLSIDFNTSILYNNVLWAGISFRNFNSLAMLAQVIFQDKIRVGFAYEFPLSRALIQSQNAFATFELMANINLAIFDVQSVQLMYY